MNNFLKRTWVEIDLHSLDENIENIKNAAPEREIMAVVKANAYGHGDIEISKELMALGIKNFAVSNVCEGVHLRKHDISGNMLIFGYTPIEELDMACNYSLVQTILDTEYAVKASEYAVKNNLELRVCIKFDTGMGRIGLRCDDEAVLIENIKKITALKGLKIEGAFTHFAVADSTDEENIAYTKNQQRLFEKCVLLLKENGITLNTYHSLNSAGGLFYSGFDSTAERAGICMYGQKPDASLTMPFELKPVMQLKSTVCMLKTIHKGDFVSYGRTYKADKDITVATVPIGYADGYPRALSNKADMLIHGKRASIIGRVCMDQLMLDVTDIPEVCVGDTVTVFGKDGNCEIPLDELAGKCDTINYELLCAIGIRVPRVYIKDGKIIKTTSYI